MSHRKLERSISKTRPQAPRVDQEIPALLGVTFYDQTLVQVPDRPGYVYARIRSNLSEVVHAFNETVVPAYDLPVLLVRDPVDRSRYRVMRRDLGRYPGGGWGNSDPYLPLHGDTHSFNPDDPGGDITWVFPQQFTPYLVYPGTTGTVKVYPYTYHYAGDWYLAGGTGTASLIPYKPTGTSTARMVLVYGDYAGNPQLVGGSEFSAAFTGTSQIFNYLPDPPGDCMYALAGVRLTTGTFTLGWSNLYDVRPFFDLPSVTGSSAGTSTSVSTPTYPAIYDDNTFKATGTAIHFNDNLDVVYTGTSVWVDGSVFGAHASITDVSNPPTETELISAFGSPDTFADQHKIGVLNDAAAGTSAYAVFSDGGHYWYLPLAKSSSTTLFVTGTSSTTLATQAGQWFGRASIKRLSTDVLVLVYREGSHHAVNDGELHIRFSDDNGATWSNEDKTLADADVTGFPMNPTGKTASQDAGEPWLYLAPNGNLILHMWRIDYEVDLDGTYQSVSTDGGATWSASAAVNFTGIVDDSVVFATDDDFVYNGVIYAGARVYSEADGDPSQSILIKSTDNGTTWEKVSVICDTDEGGTGGQEVGLEYLGNDTIIAMIRDNPHTASYKRISTDMGVTWGTLTDVTSTVGIAARQRVYTRAHLKGYTDWWTDSVLIMVGFIHTSSGNSQPRRNAIWISQDRGTTWSTPQYIAAQTEDAGYGDIFYDSTNDQWVVVTYQGELAEADLVQYNLRITGI